MDVLKLAQDLIALPSPSAASNAEVTDYLERILEREGFDAERLVYQDENGVAKHSLVARRGAGRGGLGFFSHSDTVPGGEGWDAFDPVVKDGRLYGRGSCDMKGPLAATIAAASRAAPRAAPRSAGPVWIVVSADEENGFGGAKQIAAESQLVKTHGWPAFGVVAEPTELRPVRAHKGGVHIVVTALGEAAHTSTDLGSSSNFLIAPFLAEMSELAECFRSDPRFQDPDFDPPTNGFNLTLNDHGAAPNVTAAKTTATLSFRTMPRSRGDEALDLIAARARAHGLALESRSFEPFDTPPDAPVVRLALDATGAARAEAVPYGTEALVYQPFVPLVVLGPGNIAQAHTVGEWLDLAQLQRAVAVYGRMLGRLD